MHSLCTLETKFSMLSKLALEKIKHVFCGIASKLEQSCLCCIFFRLQQTLTWTACWCVACHFLISSIDTFPCVASHTMKWCTCELWTQGGPLLLMCRCELWTLALTNMTDVIPMKLKRNDFLDHLDLVLVDRSRHSDSSFYTTACIGYKSARQNASPKDLVVRLRTTNGKKSRPFVSQHQTTTHANELPRDEEMKSFESAHRRNKASECEHFQSQRWKTSFCTSSNLLASVSHMLQLSVCLSVCLHACVCACMVIKKNMGLETAGFSFFICCRSPCGQLSYQLLLAGPR